MNLYPPTNAEIQQDSHSEKPLANLKYEYKRKYKRYISVLISRPLYGIIIKRKLLLITEDFLCDD